MVCGGFKGLAMWRKVRSCLGAASPNFPEAANSSKTTECGIEESPENHYRGHEFTGTH